MKNLAPLCSFLHAEDVEKFFRGLGAVCLSSDCPVLCAVLDCVTRDISPVFRSSNGLFVVKKSTLDSFNYDVFSID